MGRKTLQVENHLLVELQACQEVLMSLFTQMLLEVLPRVR